MLRPLTFAFVALALATTFPARADGELDRLITANDLSRLAAFDQTREMALAEARKQGSPSDIATLDSVVGASAMPFAHFDMVGDWRCRTIKAGGPTSLVVYGWFRCSVSDDGSGWFLQKRSGSQRTQGRFYTESDTRLTYLGAFHVAGDPAPRYDAGPDSDQVGYAIRTGERSFRIEFPAPRFESKLDILEFKR